MLGLAYFAGSQGDRQGSDPPSAAGRLQEERTLAVQVSAFVHEFQKERGLTALFVGSQGAKSGTELKTERALTDRTPEGAPSSSRAPEQTPPRDG